MRRFGFTNPQEVIGETYTMEIAPNDNEYEQSIYNDRKSKGKDLHWHFTVVGVTPRINMATAYSPGWVDAVIYEEDGMDFSIRLSGRNNTESPDIYPPYLQKDVPGERVETLLSSC